LDAEPAQTEFAPAIGSVDQIFAQQQMFRRFADISLGLTISSSFLRWGQVEFQKGQLTKNDVDDDLEESDAPLAQPELEEGSDDAIANLEESAEEDSEDVSLLELKSQFFPGMFGGYGAGFGGAAPTQTKAQLEEAGSQAKFAALKAMHIQFYIAGSDVQQTYWANKIASMVLPPQLSVFKLYKTYLNTMALSYAFQFHDSFTQEAYLDDFNDRWGLTTGSSSQLSEALAEQQTYSHWSVLAMFKYQLFTINMYEKMVFGQIFAQAAAAQAAPAPAQQATSYLETEPSTTGSQFMPGMFGGQFGGYMQYYSMWLKYSSIMLEIQLANAGLMVANTKAAANMKNADVSASVSKNAQQMEGQYLPMLYTQWASTNQMKYYIEYYSLMTEMFFPQLAVAQAADRAENVFTNLVQTDAPTLTEPAKAN
jgi:hypothetical protein